MASPSSSATVSTGLRLFVLHCGPPHEVPSAPAACMDSVGVENSSTSMASLTHRSPRSGFSISGGGCGRGRRNGLRGCLCGLLWDPCRCRPEGLPNLSARHEGAEDCAVKADALQGCPFVFLWSWGIRTKKGPHGVELGACHAAPFRSVGRCDGGLGDRWKLPLFGQGAAAAQQIHKLFLGYASALQGVHQAEKATDVGHICADMKAFPQRGG